MLNTDALLTPQQVAALLATDRRTVARLCNSGRLPAVNIGSGARYRTWRVRLADLQAFMTPNNTPPSPAPPKPKLPPHIRNIARKFM
jgi:excisionase family DNA binding protein